MIRGNKVIHRGNEKNDRKNSGTAKEHHGFLIYTIHRKSTMEMKAGLYFCMCMNLKSLAKISIRTDY